MKERRLHRSANNGFVFVVKNLWVVSGVIFDVESESGIRISLSRQDFEIFEVMFLKNGGFRYFWGYVQSARHFFGFFLKYHHLALLFPFKMSYWTVTSDFFTEIRPYQVLTFIRTTYWAFTLTLVHTILHSKIYLELCNQFVLNYFSRSCRSLE